MTWEVMIEITTLQVMVGAKKMSLKVLLRMQAKRLIPRTAADGNNYTRWSHP
jgi:hypothetical protein